MLSSHTRVEVAAAVSHASPVLVTDGSPTTCDTATANLTKIVADGKARGVSTFVLGLPGSAADFLNALAQAGGTTSAVDV